MYEVDAAIEPVGATVGSRSEEQSVVILSRRVIAKRDPQQARHGEGSPGQAVGGHAFVQRAQRLSRHRIKFPADSVWSAEVGTKNALSGGRAQLDLSVYYMRP